MGYVEADMEAAFPVLALVRDALPRRKEVEDCFNLPHRKSLAWGCHTEAILLWWRSVSGTSKQPELVWIVEDDAAYSGEISEFLLSYSHEFCPVGHYLTPFETPEDDYSCSKCGQTTRSGTCMQHCELCDYDICSCCRAAYVEADLITHQFRKVEADWVW